MKVVQYLENLKKKSKDVEKFDKKIFGLVSEMFRVTETQRGVGLAAIQLLGIDLNVLVINNFKNGGFRGAFINPKMEVIGNETNEAEEGCLSAPGKYVKKVRYSSIKVKYQNLQGKFAEIELKDFDARIFQHEFDHLNGVMFIE